jgi:hypothetical protein
MDQNRPSLSLIEIPMYLGAVLYVLVGIGMFVFGLFLVNSGEVGDGAQFLLIIFAMSAVFCFVLAGFFAYATTQLKHRKKWAWITAVVVGAMYTPSAFIFLGVPILIGCFNSDVNAWFNGGPQNNSQRPAGYQQPQPPTKSDNPYQQPRQ